MSALTDQWLLVQPQAAPAREGADRKSQDKDSGQPIIDCWGEQAELARWGTNPFPACPPFDNERIMD
jgi:hypothetical protein